MSNLNQWAIRNGVTAEALLELRELFNASGFEPTPLAGESEGAVQTRIRLEASKKGMRMWRNNVGATITAEGGFLRYGLANDSKAMNDHMKSHDLIGIRPVLITQAHVGTIIGQFTTREVKKGSWTYSGTKREQAQLRFAELIVSLGGDAAFANCEGTL